MVHRWLVVAMFLVAFLPSATRAQAALDDSQLRAEMERALREENLVGVVWALVKTGGVSIGAAGLADARLGEPLRAENRVQIGSVTKTLIAAGVLQLVTEGKLVLDAPVATYLPDVEVRNPWAADHPMLVRHLVDHTSGLDDARLWQVFSLEPRPDTPLREGVGIDRGSLRLRTRPGSRFSYSNTGYTLLGMVIEAVVGQRYEPYLDAHLLHPLGMTQSTFGFVSQAGQERDALLAMGHFEGGTPHPAVPWYLRPAGQFTTTAADMARFARFLMGNGEVDGVPFIDARLLRAMGKPSTTDAAAAGLAAGYGLGLSQRDRYGVLGRCHSGNIVGYRAMLCLFPEEQKAFFVSMNADSEDADYGRFDSLLVRALDVAAATVGSPAAAPADAAAWEGIYVRSPSRFESFAYLDVVMDFLTVRSDGEGIRLEPFMSPGRELRPVGGSLFRAHDRAATSHALLTSSDGTRIISDGFQSYERVGLSRMMPLWVSLITGLLGILYIAVAGIVRLLRRSLRRSEPIVVPFVAIMAFVVPVALLLAQPFLRLGDLTPASATLALVTGALPLSMIVGLVQCARRGIRRRTVAIDALALAAVLQWTMVLTFWGLMPLRLWA